MFLSNFTKKYPKLKLIIEELNTDEIILKLKNGQLDAAIAVTPLEDEKLKEIVLYFEPFVAYMPNQSADFSAKEIEISDLSIDEILLLEDGHCFRNGILNLCKNHQIKKEQHFQLKSGSFETLIKLADEGLGITLLPYLHAMELKEKDQQKIVAFKDPKPAREVSLVFPKTALKNHIIEALTNTISGVIKGAIAFQNVQIVSPIYKKQ
jgi:LysR family hydrogen peroxide-inducible transcriptional activator